MRPGQIAADQRGGQPPQLQHAGANAHHLDPLRAGEIRVDQHGVQRADDAIGEAHNAAGCQQHGQAMVKEQAHRPARAKEHQPQQGQRLAGQAPRQKGDRNYANDAGEIGQHQHQQHRIRRRIREGRQEIRHRHGEHHIQQRGKAQAHHGDFLFHKRWASYSCSSLQPCAQLARAASCSP